LPKAAPSECANADSQAQRAQRGARAFYQRNPQAGGLVTVSRPGISPDGKEAFLVVSRLMVMSTETRLLHLRKRGDIWKIEDVIVLESTPGC
jgi:hypothetical protein